MTIRPKMTARHAALRVALVAACVTIAATARAEMNLQWEAPPECPQRSEVLDRIRALAGSSLDDTEGLSAEGKIVHDNGRFWLTLLVRDGPDVKKRVIASDSCADLAGAAAINVALLLGVDVGALESQTSNAAPDQRAPQDAAPAGAAGQSDATRGDEHKARAGARSEQGDNRAKQTLAQSKSVATASSAPSKSRWNVVLRAPILVADLGPLPGAILGVGLGGGVRYESWRLVLQGRLFQERTISPAEVAAGADVQRVTGQLDVCHGWRFVQFEIAPCLGIGLEYLRARGTGEGVSPETRQTIWAAPSAGAVAHWYALDYMAVFFGVSGYLELSRPRLVIEGIGEIQQLAPAAAGIALGLEWIL